MNEKQCPACKGSGSLREKRGGPGPRKRLMCMVCGGIGQVPLTEPERMAKAAPAMLRALYEAERSLSYAIGVLDAPNPSAIRQTLDEVKEAIGAAEGG